MHKQRDDFYINRERNMYQTIDSAGAIRAMCTGRSIYTGDRIDRLFIEEIEKKNKEKQIKIEKRVKKAKKRIWNKKVESHWYLT